MQRRDVIRLPNGRVSRPTVELESGLETGAFSCDLAAGGKSGHMGPEKANGVVVQCIRAQRPTRAGGPCLQSRQQMRMPRQTELPPPLPPEYCPEQYPGYGPPAARSWGYPKRKAVSPCPGVTLYFLVSFRYLVFFYPPSTNARLVDWVPHSDSGTANPSKPSA